MYDIISYSHKILENHDKNKNFADFIDCMNNDNSPNLYNILKNNTYEYNEEDYYFAVEYCCLYNQIVNLKTLLRFKDKFNIDYSKIFYLSCHHRRMLIIKELTDKVKDNIDISCDNYSCLKWPCKFKYDDVILFVLRKYDLNLNSLNYDVKNYCIKVLTKT